jgi:hypothetical protein
MAPEPLLAAIRWSQRHDRGMRALGERLLSYSPAGATRPADARWIPPAGFRGYERTVVLGSGERLFEGVAGVDLEPISARGDELVTHVSYRVIR